MIDNLPPLRDVIAAHDLAAKKSLGQNFLLDLNLTAKIARLAGDLSGSDVLEIGPGPGGLTRGLLAEGARRVLAIEKDPRCMPVMAEIAAAYPDRLQAINGGSWRNRAAKPTDGWPFWRNGGPIRASSWTCRPKPFHHRPRSLLPLCT